MRVKLIFCLPTVDNDHRYPSWVLQKNIPNDASRLAVLHTTLAWQQAMEWVTLLTFRPGAGRTLDTWPMVNNVFFLSDATVGHTSMVCDVRWYVMIEIRTNSNFFYKIVHRDYACLTELHSSHKECAFVCCLICLHLPLILGRIGQRLLFYSPHLQTLWSPKLHTNSHSWQYI